MNDRGMGRRAFLHGAGLAALSAAGIVPAQPSRAQNAVPNSSGAEPAKLKAPAHACDCHHHIYDADRFPPAQPERNPTRVSRNTVCCSGGSARHGTLS